MKKNNKDYSENKPFQPILIIKLNANAAPTDCPFCGKDTNPNIGAELMLEKTDLVVCRDCGLKYAPALVALLHLGEAANLFHQVENDFGAAWQAANAPKTTGLDWNEFQFLEILK